MRAVIVMLCLMLASPVSAEPRAKRVGLAVLAVGTFLLVQGLTNRSYMNCRGVKGDDVLTGCAGVRTGPWVGMGVGVSIIGIGHFIRRTS